MRMIERRRLRAVVSPGLFALMLTALPAGAADGWPDLSSPATAVGGGEDDAAVVVGVEKYFAVPPVPGAEANAKAWYDYLTKTRGTKASSVKLLLDNDAAREDMLEAAQRAAAKVGPRGTLWFVFIGHGAPGADGKDGLLVGVDAQQKAESLQIHSVKRGELLKALSASKAGKIVVVLDACFSGRGPDGTTIAPGLQPLVTVIAAEAADPRMAVLTAARGDQFAGPLPGAERPAFSYLVLGGLRGWAGKAKVTAADLWEYASDVLEATLSGRNQTPDLVGNKRQVVGVSAGEQGPDLTALAKGAAGGGSVVGGGKAAPATAGNADIRWVKVPGGTFAMGTWDSDLVRARPVHQVTLKTLQFAKTLVTNKQYRACVAAGACTETRDCGRQYVGDDQPVVCVDWEQAQAFSQWVGGRLPTEAEWEYAARSAGKDRKFPWGDEDATCERAVISEGGYGCGRNVTWPVCSKTAGNTEQGLCDMAGNTWEWMQDWSHDSYDGAPADGSAWKNPPGLYRVIRGGSWSGVAGVARSANRDVTYPGNYTTNLGFRPVRSNP
jgi:formylglycine-generating enzyme required for sulfatase activity